MMIQRVVVNVIMMLCSFPSPIRRRQIIIILLMVKQKQNYDYSALYDTHGTYDYVVQWRRGGVILLTHFIVVIMRYVIQCPCRKFPWSNMTIIGS